MDTQLDKQAMASKQEFGLAIRKEMRDPLKAIAGRYGFIYNREPSITKLIHEVGYKRYAIIPTAKLTSMPASPGVYFLFNESGQIIYVASSANLIDVTTNDLNKLKPELTQNSMMSWLTTPDEATATEISQFIQMSLGEITEEDTPEVRRIFRFDSDEQYIKLEKMAKSLGFGTVNEMFCRVADKTKFLSLPSRPWEGDRIQAMLQAVWTAQDLGQHNTAYTLAKLLLERQEVSPVVKEQLAYLEKKDWFAAYGELQEFITQRQQFKITYEHGSGKQEQFTVLYAKFDQPPGERHIYLAALCAEENGKERIPDLARNHSFRLDRVLAIEPMGQDMEDTLPTVHASFVLTGSWIKGYEQKAYDLDDLLYSVKRRVSHTVMAGNTAWRDQDWDYRKITRRAWSSFWFTREMLRYGDGVEVLERIDLRNMMCDRLRKALSKYEPDLIGS